MGQLTKKMTGSFSANAQVNPKEQCKIIITISGREVRLRDERKISDESETSQEGSVEREKKKSETVTKEEKNTYFYIISSRMYILSSKIKIYHYHL